MTYPRRVPIPLFPSVETELKRLQDLGVFAKVNKATQWCAPMVVTKKARRRTTPMYGEPYKQIIRERVLMQKMEESLEKLSQILSMLDVTAGCWNTLLAKEYTMFLDAFWTVSVHETFLGYRQCQSSCSVKYFECWRDCRNWHVWKIT